MANYRLIDDGYHFKKIVRGRHFVGRVVKHADGRRYYARLGKSEAYGLSEIEAFQRVVARHCGFESADELREANRDIRRQNRRARQQAWAEMDRESGGMLTLLNSLTRGLR